MSDIFFTRHCLLQVFGGQFVAAASCFLSKMKGLGGGGGVRERQGQLRNFRRELFRVRQRNFTLEISAIRTNCKIGVTQENKLSSVQSGLRWERLISSDGRRATKIVGTSNM